jgi:hypothetical protein
VRGEMKAPRLLQSAINRARRIYFGEKEWDAPVTHLANIRVFILDQAGDILDRRLMTSHGINRALTDGLIYVFDRYMRLLQSGHMLDAPLGPSPPPAVYSVEDYYLMVWNPSIEPLPGEVQGWEDWDLFYDDATDTGGRMA